MNLTNSWINHDYDRLLLFDFLLHRKMPLLYLHCYILSLLLRLSQVENIHDFCRVFLWLSGPKRCSDSFISEFHPSSILNGNQLSATYCSNTIENAIVYVWRTCYRRELKVWKCVSKMLELYYVEMTKSTWSHVISINTMCASC